MRDSTKVPFFILGFLARSGPLHGYQIKLKLEQEVSDFTQIKMSNLYYHLGAMHEKKWIKSTVEKSEKHPDREVYRITSLGKHAFDELTEEYLSSKLMFDFPLDGALFFINNITTDVIEESLAASRTNITDSLAKIKSHKAETLPYIPENFRAVAELIFTHHEMHYQAEQKWLKQVSQLISRISVSQYSEEEKDDGKA